MGQQYRGRFAPSPTGPMHLGSLVTALGSWVDARQHSGVWLVRMEDVDGPRCRTEWGEMILRSLAAHGLTSDEEVMWQSNRSEAYREALSKMDIYACGCSRAQLGNGPYRGTCRNGLPPGKNARAWRFRVRPGVIAFDDRLEGYNAQDVERSVGDFVLLRADGCFAYQLAVVVDDIAQGITDVVRGADLLDSTPRQLLLYEALGAAPPRYMHLPLVLSACGEKLSKQTLAPALDDARPEENLRETAGWLGLNPPTGSISQILDWCILRR